MKKLSIFLIILFVGTSSIAQTKISNFEFQKINREGLTNDLLYPEKLVAAAIRETMEKAGFKGKERNGFIVYKGVSLSLLGKETYDLYFQTDRKSRKEKETTTVNMLVSKGEEQFVTDASDPLLMRNSREWLDNLRNIVALYDLEQQIAEQEELVKRNEKIMAGLKDDADDLDKKKKKIEQQIEDNGKAQSSHQKESVLQVQALEILKAKRVQ